MGGRRRIPNKRHGPSGIASEFVNHPNQNIPKHSFGTSAYARINSFGAYQCCYESRSYSIFISNTTGRLNEEK